MKRDGGLMMLKADLHLHTHEGEAFIAYDARGLIDRAARGSFQVLSITNHDTVTFDDELAAYARERGILLIPGVEATIEGRHALIYNLDVPPAHIQTFAGLRRLRGPEWLVVADQGIRRPELAHQMTNRKSREAVARPPGRASQQAG